MRILHLSDLHLNPFYNKSNIVKTELVLSRAVELGFDHLVITGDIAHDADRESYLIFRNLLKKYNLLESQRTSMIIGNHDIFGGVHTVKDLINFPERCKTTDYNHKIFEFVSIFEELFIDCIFPEKENKIFPYAKIFGQFVFIGINTNDIYSRIKNPFASNGKIFKYDLEKLENLFEVPEIKERTKIILAHHHFNKNSFDATPSNNELWNKIEGYTLKLRGKKKILKSFLKNDVRLVLHGHSHENKNYERMGIEFNNTGGSIDNDNKGLATLNFVELENNKIKMSEEILLVENQQSTQMYTTVEELIML